ncbi:hypothetical protein Y032_0022g496 [Ancylostoma ceylanicum]|uniref:SCP domain-containing protein n=1 Tax=Ancylostoma ceylanicum TaxID=53326 RepID=A0A016UYU0_9BILA|nr:hypothetical protein Y032_0022g496 [Ancylostoma ceylanicum]
MKLFTTILIVVLYLIPLMQTSRGSLEEPPNCEEQEPMGPSCPKPIRKLLFEKISKKLSYIGPKYDCGLEDGAAGKLILDDAYPSFFLDLEYRKDLRFSRIRQRPSQTVFNVTDFINRALAKWSKEFAEVRARMMNKFGCNYIIGDMEDANYYNHSLCCLFN